MAQRVLRTHYGEFNAIAFKDKPSQSLHLARWCTASGCPEQTVAVRVHEP